VVGFILLACGSLLDLAGPAFIGWGVDAITNCEYDTVNQLCWQLMVVVVFSGLFSSGRTYVFGYISCSIERDLRKEFYTTIIKKDVAFYDENKTGELLSRLNSDVEAICSSLSSNVSAFVRSILFIIFVLIACLLISPTLTGITFVSIVPIIIGAVFLGKMIRKLSRKKTDDKAKMSIIAQESFANIRTVKAFANEDRESDKFKVEVKAIFEVGL
jgi:ABC-type multidrug transport system fused ATPase/permease subunit